LLASATREGSRNLGLPGGGHTCALREDGSATYWGEQSRGT